MVATPLVKNTKVYKKALLPFLSLYTVCNKELTQRTIIFFLNIQFMKRLYIKCFGNFSDLTINLIYHIHVHNNCILENSTCVRVHANIALHGVGINRILNVYDFQFLINCGSHYNFTSIFSALIQCLHITAAAVTLH